MYFKFVFQSMEFSPIWYSSFWSLISVVFSATGIYALHNATIPVSDELKKTLVLAFDALLTFSISYAFLFRPSLEEHRLHARQNAPRNKIFYHHVRCFAGLIFPSACFTGVVHFLILSNRNLWQNVLGISLIIISVGWFSLVLKLIILGFKKSQTTGNFFTGFANPLRLFPHHDCFWVLFQGFWLLSLVVHESPVGWNLRMLGFYESVPSALFFVVQILCVENKSIATPSMDARVRQLPRLIEIVCGTLASTVAQYWFRVQSVPLLLGFLSLAMAWLGILANVHPRCDFGLLEFFVSMSLQSAVSLLGLHFYTFLVVLGGIGLLLVKWMSESVSLRYFDLKSETMTLKELEGIKTWLEELCREGELEEERRKKEEMGLGQLREWPEWLKKEERRLEEEKEWPEWLKKEKRRLEEERRKKEEWEEWEKKWEKEKRRLEEERRKKEEWEECVKKWEKEKRRSEEERRKKEEIDLQEWLAWPAWPAWPKKEEWSEIELLEWPEWSVNDESN